MLYTLRLNGVLEHTKALLVGQFTDYNPSKDHPSMQEMVENMVSDYDFPVAYNLPIGHIDHSLPIIEGAEVELSITETDVHLNFSPNDIH